MFGGLKIKHNFLLNKPFFNDLFYQVNKFLEAFLSIAKVMENRNFKFEYLMSMVLCLLTY